ncbi:rhodanese-like domain-containing protein [Jeotgalibacillus sp. ET6]|uniref:rhodanese-like domain-containing protein n=1 Tax=Jeotgalibacillus sp. ET6 TaxID=3037260 RepID=UPI002418485F|nr:rhodanese-like domain-containing protein [Jeotgalibacillus sp. ET6]MDG5472230.1 rhodanese-like domain-containing protein [Jeotgalibacillus sp. ET6]
METAFLIVAVLVIGFMFVNKMGLFAKGIKQSSTEELEKDLNQKDKQYVDVRTPAEFKRGAVPGFRNIPLNELPKRLNELKKDQEVVVMCQSGMRSMKGSTTLKKNGFSSVTNIKGGMSAWNGKVKKQ